MTCITVILILITFFTGLGLLSNSLCSQAYKSEKIKVENQYQSCLEIVKIHNSSNLHYIETIKEINNYNTLIEVKQNFLKESLLNDFCFDFYMDMPIINYKVLNNGIVIIQEQ